MAHVRPPPPPLVPSAPPCPSSSLTHLHPDLSRFIWSVASIFLGVYSVAQNINIPIIVRRSALRTVVQKSDPELTLPLPSD